MHEQPALENHSNLPAYIRLPKAGKRCPYTGLTRSYLNYLILPSEANGYKPWVKSHVLRQQGTKHRGVRLIDLASLLAYIASQPSHIQQRLTRQPICEPEASAEGEAKPGEEDKKEEGGESIV